VSDVAEEIVDGFERIQKIVATVVVTIAGGIYAFLQGVFTLEPAFLLTGEWFAPISLTSRYIGPQVWPALPWSTVALVSGIAMLAVTLYKLNGTRSKNA